LLKVKRRLAEKFHKKTITMARSLLKIEIQFEFVMEKIQETTIEG